MHEQLFSMMSRVNSREAAQRMLAESTDLAAFNTAASLAQRAPGVAPTLRRELSTLSASMARVTSPVALAVRSPALATRRHRRATTATGDAYDPWASLRFTSPPRCFVFVSHYTRVVMSRPAPWAHRAAQPGQHMLHQLGAAGAPELPMVPRAGIPVVADTHYCLVVVILLH